MWLSPVVWGALQMRFLMTTLPILQGLKSVG